MQTNGINHTLHEFLKMIDPEGESYAHEVGYGHTSIMLKPPVYQQSTAITVQFVLYELVTIEV